MPITPFNRSLVRRRRTRAADSFASVDFIKQRAALLLADRMQDMSRRFPRVLDLGSHSGQLAQALTQTGQVKHVIRADSSIAMLAAQPGEAALVADEEWLPFAAESLDAICSAWALHTVNDLPGCLIQSRMALKADGLFLAVLPGARTLLELRQVLLEDGEEYGISPRIAPFLEVRDAGALLQRAGFALPVVDSELLTVTYADLPSMLREIKRMGESNPLNAQFKGLSGKAFWPRIAARYAERFGLPDGRIPATVEFLTLTAWKPHASQQQPLAW